MDAAHKKKKIERKTSKEEIEKTNKQTNGPSNGTPPHGGRAVERRREGDAGEKGVGGIEGESRQPNFTRHH